MAAHPKRTDGNGNFYCPRCRQFLPMSGFDKSKRTHFGIQTWCKSCITAKRIEWKSEPNVALRGLVRRARGRGRGCSLPKDWAIHKFAEQSGLCHYTGIEMTFGLGKGRVWTNVSIDRMDSSLGYTEDNCVLCCLGFNLMKTDLTLEALQKLCAAFMEKCNG